MYLGRKLKNCVVEDLEYQVSEMSDLRALQVYYPDSSVDSREGG
jgi:hypothetical protein